MSIATSGGIGDAINGSNSGARMSRGSRRDGKEGRRLDLLHEGAREQERGRRQWRVRVGTGGSGRVEDAKASAGARGGGGREGLDAGEFLHHGAEVGGVGGEHRRRGTP